MFDPGNNVDELGGLGKINAVALRLIDDLVQKIQDLTEVNIEQVIPSGNSQDITWTRLKV